MKIMRHQKIQAPADARPAVRLLFVLVFLVVSGWCHQSHAQWITQANVLKAGWNSVYLHVDASHTNANSLLIGTPNIEEVWMWTFDLPPGLALATPPDPTLGVSSQWSKWTKLEGATNTMRLPGNAALLVKASAPTTWSVKGRPVAPSYRWTLTGLNFVGFPTATPGDAVEQAFDRNEDMFYGMFYVAYTY